VRCGKVAWKRRRADTSPARGWGKLNTMGGSIKIGRAFGIDVKVHWSFFLLLAFFGYLAFGDSGSFVDALVTVGIVVALFFCVLLHEFGHSLVAIRLGSEVQDITLLPIGGAAHVNALLERHHPGGEQP